MKNPFCNSSKGAKLCTVGDCLEARSCTTSMIPPNLLDYKSIVMLAFAV